MVGVEAIWSSIHSISPCSERLVTRRIVLVKEHFFLLHLEPFLTDFVLQTHQLANVTFAIHRLTFLKAVDEQNFISIPKYWGHNLTFWPLWTLLTDCSPLGLRPLWLRSVVMDPGFVHCHIPTQKIRFISAKQLQTALGINDTLSFLIHREQTRHPLCQQLPHRQMFMQNSVHTSVWYL